MKPQVLQPILKDYLWGGTRLKEEYGFATDKPIAAEAWMLSSHKDGRNINEEVPVLIKLIDARDKLSVQVHPNDDYAWRVEGEPGKTEMWYIVDHEPGAQLIYGFNREVSKQELEDRIRNNTLDEVVNYVPVHKGDVFFIPAGTLHAIGAGILIAEIQQNSNTTYRVSDYGRLGADGKPRPLHIDKALDVTTAEPPTVPYGQVGKVTHHPYGIVRQLADCEYFSVDHIALNGIYTLQTQTFAHFLVLDGEIAVNDISVAKGGSIYISEGCEVTVQGKAEYICTTRR
ncbi:MAG: class I mannose-6-phosphate isomerase [Oscillospiraceae bacterium]|nr:class I mannose-6-phosphate isomerase [Oscillospiraceae bacterium]